jgi:hypothetical protein
VHAWQLRRNVLRRDLRSAVCGLSRIAEQRTARSRVASAQRHAARRFRPLSEAEAEAIVGAELLAQLAASTERA